MEDKKLKPCPFCGAKVEIKEDGRGHDVIAAYVLCEGCGAAGKEFTYGYMSGKHQEAYDAAAAAWNRRAKQKKESQEVQQNITKSGFFKINPYREYVFRAPLETWFTAVEAALGFKLFFWQKTYIEHGVFRYYGKTTAEILRELSQINEPPLDLIKYKTRGHKERWFCDELLRMKATLDDAEVPTREVLLSENDRIKWLRQKLEAETTKATGIPEEMLRPRKLEKFWDF